MNSFFMPLSILIKKKSATVFNHRALFYQNTEGP
jgi:hypothetical protein